MLGRTGSDDSLCSARQGAVVMWREKPAEPSVQEHCQKHHRGTKYCIQL